MGNAFNKTRGLCLPGQSGKTYKMIEFIRNELALSDSPGNVLNILIASNNQILVQQTESRLASELPALQGDVFSWISDSTKKSPVSVSELAWKITTGEISMVVMCANKPRMEYLSQLFAELQKINTKHINVWIDEADETIGLWSRYTALHDISLVQQVTLVTATGWDEIIKKYGPIEIIGVENTCNSSYRGLRDCEKNVEEFENENAVEFVHEIIRKYPHLTTPGARAFVPGDRWRDSHYAVATTLRASGFAVVVINGSRRELLIPGREPIDLRPMPPPLSNVVAQVYKDHDLHEFPFAITGRCCVDRGVTIQSMPTKTHNGFLFTYGIFPSISSKSSAYQIFARLFGNFGDSPDYKRVAVYTTKAMFSKVEKQESIAMNLARLVHENETERVGMAELKGAQDHDASTAWNLFTGEFSTAEQAYQFAKEHGAKRAVRAVDQADMVNGFATASLSEAKRVYEYAEIVLAMSRWSTLSGFDVSKKQCLPGDAFSRRTICYRDTSDPTSIVFIMRVIQKK